jgi:hypothetical protein
LAVNSRPGSVSRAGSTGRTRALHGMHLGARFGEMRAGEGRTEVAHDHGASARNRMCEKAGKTGKRADDVPYRNAELLEHLLDGGK